MPETPNYRIDWIPIDGEMVSEEEILRREDVIAEIMRRHKNTVDEDVPNPAFVETLRELL